jgi:hypothetical protein
MNLCIVGNQTSEGYQKIITGLKNSNSSIIPVGLNDKFDYAMLITDIVTPLIFDKVLKSNTYYPNRDFIIKSKLNEKCIASGIPVLPTLPFSVENLRNCNYNNFIIKPVYWSGGKHVLPYVYKIFSKAEVENVIESMSTEFIQGAQGFIIQKALIDNTTQETTLLFVDGVINGSGKIHFNSISEKQMLNSKEDDGNITWKFGVRPVSDIDKFGFKEKITKLLKDNNIHNTFFKAQAVVDKDLNTCYIIDWSWTLMPYIFLNILPIEYLINHMEFVYDIVPEVTKPVDKIIIIYHIAFHKSVYNYSEEQFNNYYLTMANNNNVVRVEPLITRSAPTPTVSDFYVLYGTACDSEQEGKQNLQKFQEAVNTTYPT